MRILGIDPGVYGAMVVIDEKGMVGQRWCAMPIREVEGKLDPALRFDVKWLKETLSRDSWQHDCAFLELPTLYGQIGKYNLATLVFSFASVYVLLPNEPNCITAQTWRKEMLNGLVGRSDLPKRGRSRQKKESLAAFWHHCSDPVFQEIVASIKHPDIQSGLAEAYLIALYGLRISQREEVSHDPQS